MAHRGSETEFELATIERLYRLGYRHIWDRPGANEFLVVNQLPVLFQVANKTVAKG